jgi:hypothetical protein
METNRNKLFLVTYLASPMTSEPPSTLFAMSSLDGTLKLQDIHSNILWDVRLDHQVFELSCMDITGDGNEEIIVSSWVRLRLIRTELSSAEFLTPFFGFMTGWNDLHYG